MLLLLLSSSNFAIAIDAGDQLNQIERDQKRREPLRAAPIIEEDKPTPKPKVQGETFKVNNFLFEGNTLVSSDELKAFLKAYLNLEITLDELKSAVDSISIFYKDRGYLATATLPKQDITEGIVRIIITEAKFGGTELMLDPNIKYRIQPEIIQKFVEFNHPKGEILNLNRLGRAILIADELPGVAVTQSLQPGSKEGQTNSVLDINNESAYIARVSTDNYGARATGYARYQANASFLSSVGTGDRIDVAYLHSRGVDFGRFSFSNPIGYSGLRAGVAASALKYEVVAGTALSLKPEGEAETISFDLSYPLNRSRTFDLSLTSSLERKHFRNKIDNATDSNYLVDLLNFGSSLNHKNTLFIAGETYASIDFDFGNANYDNSPASFKSTKVQQHVEGRFNRMKFAINNTQFYTETISSVLKLNGQISDTNLDSSQKIYLGGATGVRSYPTSEGSGSNGYIFSAELHKELPKNFTVLGFYDHGFAQQFNKSKDSLGAAITEEKNTFTLRGYGVSLEWTGFINTYRSSVAAIWSKRIGGHPNPETDGSDSDGRQPHNFLWIRGAINF